MTDNGAVLPDAGMDPELVRADEPPEDGQDGEDSDADSTTTDDTVIVMGDGDGDDNIAQEFGWLPSLEPEARSGPQLLQPTPFSRAERGVFGGPLDEETERQVLGMRQSMANFYTTDKASDNTSVKWHLVQREEDIASRWNLFHWDAYRAGVVFVVGEPVDVERSTDALLLGTTTGKALLFDLRRMGSSRPPGQRSDLLPKCVREMLDRPDVAKAGFSVHMLRRLINIQPFVELGDVWIRARTDGHLQGVEEPGERLCSIGHIAHRLLGRNHRCVRYAKDLAKFDEHYDIEPEYWTLPAGGVPDYRTTRVLHSRQTALTDEMAGHMLADYQTGLALCKFVCMQHLESRTIVIMDHENNSDVVLRFFRSQQRTDLSRTEAILSDYARQVRGQFMHRQELSRPYLLVRGGRNHFSEICRKGRTMINEKCQYRMKVTGEEDWWMDSFYFVTGHQATPVQSQVVKLTPQVAEQVGQDNEDIVQLLNDQERSRLRALRQEQQRLVQAGEPEVLLHPVLLPHPAGQHLEDRLETVSPADFLGPVPPGWLAEPPLWGRCGCCGSREHRPADCIEVWHAGNLNGSTDPSTWYGSMCEYPACPVPETHQLAVCPVLHFRCLRCRLRGHVTEDCQWRTMEEHIDLYNEYKDLGVYTSTYARNPMWRQVDGLPDRLNQLVVVRDKDSGMSLASRVAGPVLHPSLAASWLLGQLEMADY